MATHDDKGRPAQRPGGDAAKPRALDPARSKSVEAIEQEVDEIVDALEERERARLRSTGTSRTGHDGGEKP